MSEKGVFILYDDYIALEERIAELEKELARAKSALFREWREKASLSHGLTVSAELASGKYEREIAKEQGE